MNDAQKISGRNFRARRETGAAQGKHFWRRLDELANTEAFQKLMRLEFPEQADIWPDSLSRRHFLSLMGASLALAGLRLLHQTGPAGEDRSLRQSAARNRAGGAPLFCDDEPFAGRRVGLFVESHMGRPTKIEGQPRPPGEPGRNEHLSSGVDPDAVRSRPLAKRHVPRPHADLERGPAALRGGLGNGRKNGGAAVRILSEPILRLRCGAARATFAKSLPKAKWHVYEPIHADARLEAIRLAFGQDLNCHYDFKQADVVLSLDEDFLGCGPGNLRGIADFISRRRVRTTALKRARPE